ncbi:phage tail protein [Enterococcus massiliensis]|uniref:phage tail protein n=1 Tax=Enterococcus massiliensis TaxID=1640685 RepID=UPI00065DF8CE|nr:tape measure protein [Enterococcus massiliensis]
MNEDAYLLKMILDESGFSAGLNKATRKLGDFDGNITNSSSKGSSKMGSIWTSFVGNFAASGAMKVVSAVTGGIADLGRELSAGSATWKTFNGNMENLGKGSGEIASVKKELQDFATQTIYSASDMATTYSQLEAVGIKSSNQLVKGFGGLAAAASDPAQAMTTLSQQATQMAAKPMVQWQDFKLMLEQTPAGVAAVAKTMGMSTADMVKNVQDGTIKTQDFFDAITETGTNDTFTKMATEYKTVDQAMDGLKETLVGKLQPAYDKVTQKAIDGINKLVDAVGKMDMDAIIGKVESVIKTVKEFAPAISGIAGALLALKALKTITVIVTSVKKAITVVKGLKTAFGVLKFAVAAAGGPVTIIVAAIGALIGVIAYLWATNEDFRDAVIGIWESIKKTFVNAWKAIQDAWSGAKEWFGDLWESIKETASNAVEGVRNAWNGIKEWFLNLWSGVKETSAGAWDGIVEGVTGAVEKVKSVWDTVTEKVSAVFNRITETYSPFIEAIKEVFTNLKTFFSETWTSIQEIAGAAWEIIKNVILAPILFVTSLISGGWEEAKNNMIAVWNNITEAASTIWGAIKDIFFNYLTMIKDNFLAIWNGIKGTAENIWSNLKMFFTNTWNGIKNTASNIWNSIKIFFSNTWNNIKTVASNTWTAIKNGFSNAWNNIKTTTANVWNSIKQTFKNTVDNIVSGAQNAWGNLKKGVSDAIQKVRDTFDKLKDINLFEIGKNIIDGLLNGIQEKWNDLKGKITDIAGTITNGLKGLLDINSPSRIMRDLIGKNVVLGIVDGIEQTSPKLEKSMQNLPFDSPELPSINLKRTTEINEKADNLKNKTAPIGTGNSEVHVHLTVYGEMPDSVIRQMAKKLKVELTKQMQGDADAVGGAM